MKRARSKTGVGGLMEERRANDTYYGYIVDIWELDYEPDFKVPLFRCKWVNLLGSVVQVDPQSGMTTVDL